MAGVSVEEVGRRQFSIDTCLGRGGFGEVYKALMRSPGGLQSEVAVKVLRSGLDPAGQAVQRLRDEGRLLARLDHPTILRVHDLVLLDGRISLVTEYVDGQDLGEVVTGPHRIGVRALLEVIGPVAGALDSAWNAPLGDRGEPLRLVHRDIKPSNIRISRHGQVKLLDFGIARTDTVDREARTQTNLMVGSPAYMAPERFTENVTRPESDVFALGCALYEGLTGVRLFGDLSLPMLSALALDEDHYVEHLQKRIGELPDTLPEPVYGLMVEMLEHRPERRPAAAAVQERCEEIADEVPGKSLARWCRERPWPTPHVEEGALDGQTLTEGTLVRSGAIAPASATDAITEDRGGGTEISAASLAIERPDAGRGPRVGVVLALLSIVAIVAAVVVAAGVAGGAAMGLFGEGPQAPVAVPEGTEALLGPAAPIAEPEPAPEMPPEGAEEPAEGAEGPAEAELEPAPEPIAAEPAPTPAPARPTPEPARDPEPVPAAAPVPAPTAVAAEPQPVPEPAASPKPEPVTPTGRVEVEEDFAVELRRDGRSFPVPGVVPPGTYEIFGQFNRRDFMPGGFVTVEADGVHFLKCSPSMMRCVAR